MFALFSQDTFENALTSCKRVGTGHKLAAFESNEEILAMAQTLGKLPQFRWAKYFKYFLCTSNYTFKGISGPRLLYGPALATP
jgi:hypothetical protein